MNQIFKKSGLSWRERTWQFMEFFAWFEYALKRAGYLANKDRAEADWVAFAHALGSGFFEAIQKSNIAPMIIAEPPRKRMRDTLRWMPEFPQPISNVTELFVRGVCQVRNNLVHGEKLFLSREGGWGRSNVLLSEATAILERALEARPDLKMHFEPADDTESPLELAHGKPEVD